MKDGQDLAATTVYENVDGSFIAVDSGIAADLGGRSIGVLDYDGDGALDLFIVEDRYRGGHSRLYRNTGRLHFVDVTAAAGFPETLAGLGVATADVDGDNDVDLFVAGDNRLFLDIGERFEEAATGSFRWPPIGDEDDPAGAAFGDVDRDGRMDLVTGQPFNSTVDSGVPAPVRLFLNRTEAGGEVVFEEITDAAGSFRCRPRHRMSRSSIWTTTAGQTSSPLRRPPTGPGRRCFGVSAFRTAYLSSIHPRSW